jgi:UDP-glucuronate decarboxylase
MKDLKFNYYPYDEFEEIFSDSLEYFDFIYHCSGYGQPKKFMASPFATIKANTMDIIFIAKLLKDTGKMFYFSSSEVYTNCKAERPKEKDIGTVDPSHDRAIYIESKKIGESICWSLRKVGINVVILRVSLVFGPGTKTDDQRVLNELIIRGIENRKVDLLDEGHAVRTYLSIEQCIYWIICLTNNSKEVIYNIAGNHKLSIRDLATMTGELLKVKVEFGEKRELLEAPKLVEVDNSRIKTEHPIVDSEIFKDKLSEVVDWYKKILSNK